MPTEFKLPELGENITAGDVVRVLVAAGDTIAKDQAVVELETDKATIEVPSSVAGTVKNIAVKTGDRINVGQVVLTVDEVGGAAAGEGGKGRRPEKAEEPKSRGAERPSGEGAERVEEPGGRGVERAEATVDEEGLSQNAGQQEREGGAERGAAER